MKPIEADLSKLTKPQFEAASLILADRRHALQLAVDRVAAALREEDDVAAKYWNSVVQAVEYQLLSSA